MDLDGASRVVFSWRFFCPADDALWLFALSRRTNPDDDAIKRDDRALPR